MSSSNSNTGSGGFGITLHHEGQNDQNSISPSPSSGTGDAGKQAIQKSNDSHGSTNDAAKQGTVNEQDVKNNKP